MNSIERSLVKLVAKVAPWLAPFPSAFFVARASMTYLDLPLLVAVIVAAILETLGIATVHTALWLYDWNASKRKSDPSAPWLLAVALGVAYIVVTMTLTVALEVRPELSTYAPAMFPPLAVVGAVNLALISQQERREAEVARQKAEREKSRRKAKMEPRKVSVIRPVKTNPRDQFLSDARSGSVIPLQMSGMAIGQAYGVSGATGRRWKRKWKENGGDNIAPL